MCTTEACISFAYGYVSEFGVDFVLAGTVVDEEGIFSREVYTGLLDVSLLSEVYGQGITEGDVLHAQVCHVNEIAVVESPVVKTLVTGLAHAGVVTEVTCCENGVVVALADVVADDVVVGVNHVAVVAHLVIEDTRVGLCEGHNHVGYLPHVALTYALEEEVEVESLPCTAETQAVFEAGESVTYNLEVTVVLQSTYGYSL